MIKLFKEMGTFKNSELSMRFVRQLLERNHLAYTIEEDRILFNRHFDRRTGKKSYYEICFTEGGQKVGRQRIEFNCVDSNAYADDDATRRVCIRRSMCTDMAFFAFHFHDLFPDSYPIDEYNDWSE